MFFEKIWLILFSFDVGPILAIEECCIEPYETKKELSLKMSNIGSKLLLRVLKDLPKYMALKKPQPLEGVSYAPKITKDMFELKWEEKTAQEIYNQFRALSDTSKLYSYWKNTSTIVRFEDALSPRTIKSEITNFSVEDEDSVPGQVIPKMTKKHGKLICIKCVEGWITFRKFYYGQRGVMNSADFYNGFLKTQRKMDNSRFVSLDKIEM